MKCIYVRRRSAFNPPARCELRFHPREENAIKLEEGRYESGGQAIIPAGGKICAPARSEGTASREFARERRRRRLEASGQPFENRPLVTRRLVTAGSCRSPERCASVAVSGCKTVTLSQRASQLYTQA
jgi:hypothetical protein